MSKTRKRYLLRFVGRCLWMIATVVICIAYGGQATGQLAVLEDWNFFTAPSVFHVLWALWMYDMILQLLPLKNRNAIGSQKLFAGHYSPADTVDRQAARVYIKKATRQTLPVVILWVSLVILVGTLTAFGVLNNVFLLALTVVLYIVDLICVLFFCPFRLMMKTRCCTTCRIFNWDHMMMFSPLLFVRGFFSVSLIITAAAVMILWEIQIARHPERFWERTNTTLRCKHCTDKLCPHRSKT